MQEQHWNSVNESIAAVRGLGEGHGLPFIAAQSDLGDPEPMGDAAGVPYAESAFRWFEDVAYWRNRRLALDSPFLNAARLTSEPFFYARGRLKSWRPTSVFDSIDVSGINEISAAIVAPAHLPRGRLGAVVWAAVDPIDVGGIFESHGERFHCAALRLVSAHAEACGRSRSSSGSIQLTRREVQCLRWAAAGKTDPEIAIILSLSNSTVRFHLRNAAAKMGVTGRAQSVQVAAGLGFVGAR